MIQIIRGIVTKFVQGVYNIFTSDGRPDEVITGTMYQHYGFNSYPPVGTEHISLQFGQNNVSVAETGGNVFTEALKEGDTIVYGKSGSFVQVYGTEDGVSINTAGGNYFIGLSGDNKAITINTPTQSIRIDETDGKITLNGNVEIVKTPLLPGVLAPVATQAFVTAICTALSITDPGTFTTKSFEAL